MALEHLLGWTLHNLYGQPLPVLSHPHSKKVFPDVLREPPVFVPIASCAATEPHWKEPVSHLYHGYHSHNGPWTWQNKIYRQM